MKNFTAFISYEFEKFFTIKVTVFIACLLFISIFYQNTDLLNYKKNYSQYYEFQKIDYKSVKSLLSYQIYNVYGVRIKTIPPPIGESLIVKGVTIDPSGKVDPNDGLDISLNIKSKALFDDDSSSPFRVSFILRIIGSLLLIFYGSSFKRDIIAYHISANELSRKRLFCFLLLSRILIITFIFFFFFLSLYLVNIFHGILFTFDEFQNLLGYVLASWLMLIFFFLSGLGFSWIKNKQSQVILNIVFFGISVYFIPSAIKSYVRNRAVDIPSSYSIQAEQLTIVEKFEKDSLKKLGPFNRENILNERKNIEQFLNGDFKKIEKLENKIKKKIIENIEILRNLSVLFPTSFFNLTSDEVSGYGFENYISFYSYLEKVKREYFQYYIDKCYTSKEPGKPEPFKPINGNLFYLKMCLPRNFWTGIIINTIWCMLLGFISYRLYLKQLVHPIRAKEIGCQNIKIGYKPGDVHLYCVNDNDFVTVLVNALTGRTCHFNGQISYGGESLVNTKLKSVFYIPSASEFQDDIKTSGYLIFALKLADLKKTDIKRIKDSISPDILTKRFCDLDNSMKSHILLTIAENAQRDVYILHNVFNDLSDERKVAIKEFVDKISLRGGVVIDIETTKYAYLYSKNIKTIIINYAPDTGQYTFADFNK